jgi:hypothetical protein
VQKAKSHMLSLILEYRPNTNTAILWKTGHAKGGHKREGGGYKKEVKKVIMVDALYKNVYRILKPP